MIVNYTRQVLQGLAYLHENHTLHRDLKGSKTYFDLFEVAGTFLKLLEKIILF